MPGVLSRWERHLHARWRAPADNNGYVNAQSGFTNLFIYPGYKFKRVNGLLTNFHLPQSSLFLLVCAFAGNGFDKKTYAHAVENRYKFYSYGDCMLILYDLEIIFRVFGQIICLFNLI